MDPVPLDGTAPLPAGSTFTPGTDLINLDSTQLPGWTVPVDETGVTAGTPANLNGAADLYFGIRMRVREVGVSSTEADGGTCPHVAINNAVFNNIMLHPWWDGGKRSGWNAVGMLDIAELHQELYPTPGIMAPTQMTTATATSATATTLTDSTANWTANQFVGDYLVYTSGLAIGQAMAIISNTNNQITTSAFNPAPAWRHLQYTRQRLCRPRKIAYGPVYRSSSSSGHDS